MAQEVALGTAGSGKVRSFGVGFGLTVITLGIYYWFWYFYVNDELRDIDISRNDPTLANSRPARSVTAVILGGFLIVPPFLSVYNYGRRIERAERLVGISAAERINPALAFLLLFPGGILVIPALAHYWYVTKHQDLAVRAAAGPDEYTGSVALDRPRA